MIGGREGRCSKTGSRLSWWPWSTYRACFLGSLPGSLAIFWLGNVNHDVFKTSSQIRESRQLWVFCYTRATGSKQFSTCKPKVLNLGSTKNHRGTFKNISCPPVAFLWLVFNVPCFQTTGEKLREFPVCSWKTVIRLLLVLQSPVPTVHTAFICLAWPPAVHSPRLLQALPPWLIMLIACHLFMCPYVSLPMWAGELFPGRSHSGTPELPLPVKRLTLKLLLPTTDSCLCCAGLLLNPGVRGGEHEQKKSVRSNFSSQRIKSWPPAAAGGSTSGSSVYKVHGENRRGSSRPVFPPRFPDANRSFGGLFRSLKPNS